MKTETIHWTSLPISFLQTVADQHGFLTSAEVELLAGRDDGRLVQVLVRCGAKRFVCAAQDAASMIQAVEDGGDYVRDVSLPAGHTLWQFIEPLMK